MQAIGFDTTQVLIGGRWLACANGQTLPLFNPSDGSELARIARGGVADIDAAVAAAQAALEGPWGRATARAEEACLTAASNIPATGARKASRRWSASRR